tara:strand:+ start:7205 stop:7744 length:540 start_codon:yes stop_codon:yes gene_type:complete
MSRDTLATDRWEERMAKAVKNKTQSAKRTVKKPAKTASARKSPRRTTSKPVAEGRNWTPGHPYHEPEAVRIRTAKGRRPYFFDDPNIDKLYAMIMALAAEVSVIRERMDTHERLAEKKKWPTHQAIEDHEPDETTDAFRDQWRADYIARILRIIQVELDQIKSGESETNYDQIIEDVSK